MQKPVAFLRLMALCLATATFLPMPLMAQESPDSVMDDEEGEVPLQVLPKPVPTIAVDGMQGRLPVNGGLNPMGTPELPPMPAKKAEEPATPKEPEEPKTVVFRSAQLRGINKVTARSASIDAPLGTLVRFGNLEIIAQRCQSDELEQGIRKETALVDIWELKPNEKPARVFHGWLFADSPSLSNMTHPVYDIGLVKCGESAALPE